MASLRYYRFFRASMTGSNPAPCPGNCASSEILSSLYFAYLLAEVLSYLFYNPSTSNQLTLKVHLVSTPLGYLTWPCVVPFQENRTSL